MIQDHQISLLHQKWLRSNLLNLITLLMIEIDWNMSIVIQRITRLSLITTILDLAHITIITQQQMRKQLFLGMGM